VGGSERSATRQIGGQLGMGSRGEGTAADKCAPSWRT
jgi:hypothetical protein